MFTKLHLKDTASQNIRTLISNRDNSSTKEESLGAREDRTTGTARHQSELCAVVYKRKVVAVS